MSGIQGTPTTFNLFNLLVPKSGKTHAALFSIALGGGNSAMINWAGQQQALGSWIPQAMRVDNLTSSNEVTITEQSTGWSEVVPAGYQRTMQFPSVENPIFVLSCTGAVSVQFWLFDWPAFPDTSFNPSAAGGQSAVTIVGQPIAVVLQGTDLPPAPVTYIASSVGTTIAAGGTAQTLFAAGEVKTEGIITNPANATESLFVDPVAAATTTPAGTTFELQPGQSFTVGPAAGAVTVNAVTTGHAFSAVSS